jgi:hypothetical protein
MRALTRAQASVRAATLSVVLVAALPSAAWPDPVPAAPGAAGASATDGLAAAAACASPMHRAFDFWVGEWEVRTAAGVRVGVNRITRVHGGCALREQYSTPRGYSGESLNAYDAGARRWIQTWVDSAGTVLRLEGGLDGERMVLEGRTRDPEGHETRHRITWTAEPGGTVRQRWEQSAADGGWRTAFDGRYTRMPPSVPAR